MERSWVGSIRGYAARREVLGWPTECQSHRAQESPLCLCPSSAGVVKCQLEGQAVVVFRTDSSIVLGELEGHTGGLIPVPLSIQVQNEGETCDSTIPLFPEQVKDTRAFLSPQARSAKMTNSIKTPKA